jgi:Ca-activated chloride channel family protein
LRKRPPAEGTTGLAARSLAVVMQVLHVTKAPFEFVATGGTLVLRAETLRRRYARAVVYGPALAAALTLPFAPVVQACVPGEPSVLLMLDASESMLVYVAGGASRFEFARRSVKAALDLFPDDGLIALRFYGSESYASRRICNDSVLAVPFGPTAGNREPIKLALAGARARGRTPIAFALERAAADFPEGASRTIVLVSDGRENCDGDPCGTASALAAQGFVINTVGFQADRSGRIQLQCIAEVTGGKFFNAPAALQLTDQLLQALAVCTVAQNKVTPDWTDGEQPDRPAARPNHLQAALVLLERLHESRGVL